MYRCVHIFNATSALDPSPAPAGTRSCPYSSDYLCYNTGSTCWHEAEAVSYTHLTLPTILLV
eukprot:9125702-Pyramimonas_sp.AAC.1